MGTNKICSASKILKMFVDTADISCLCSRVRDFFFSRSKFITTNDLRSIVSETITFLLV